ncbi:MAG: RNA methyltransferase [Bacteriodetes bacterium]|nr:RNA methyltransferase [Bacteroidota bacterium]
MTVITDTNDKRIEPYHSLRDKAESEQSKHHFIAEGEKVVKRILKSSIQISSMFAAERYYIENKELIDSRIPPELQFVAGQNVMNAIVGFRMHQGILAHAKTPPSAPLSSLGKVIVALNGIVDSENVGSILRNCAAFGVDSLIADATTSSPWLRRSVRVSMGCIFQMNIHFSQSLPETLHELRTQYGYTVVTAELDSRSVPLASLSVQTPLVLVFGSEGYGVHEDVLVASNHIAHIPISNSVDSLNVAATSAVFLNSMRDAFSFGLLSR